MRPEIDGADALASFDEALPVTTTPPSSVIDTLAARAEPGLMATGSGRFHGWVVGATLPAALAADWLVSAWDQNAGMYALSPAVCAVEQVAARWVLEILDLPRTASVGFVTGGQMANTVCLAAARTHVLAQAGWDVEADGLIGAPPVAVIVGEERHHTIDRGLRLLGLGSKAIRTVGVDDAGRIIPSEVETALATVTGPTIVCAQAGNVNAGAVDPIGALRDALDAHGGAHAWLHVDGAFGLWARADPSRRSLVTGVERADSWATDAHKWLNTPYDCGMAICSRPEAHRRSLSVRASYLPEGEDGELRDPIDFNPEFSRRARAVPVWAALRQLGSDGVAALVDGCCRMAERYAVQLRAVPGVDVMHQELNQLVVTFAAPDTPDGDAAHTRRVITDVQREGTCYPSATEWRGRAAMRISVCSWRTEERDVDRSVQAITAAHLAVR